MSKEAYYFSHDSNARQDPKILAMMSVYGAEGYGWYWILIEMLRDQSEFKLDIQGKYAFNAIAMQLHTDKDAASKFVHDCIHEFELFETDEKEFWSNSLNRRMALKQGVSDKRRQAAAKRWKKEKANTSDEQMHSKSNAIKRKESKGKESKRNESKEKEIEDPASNNVTSDAAVFYVENIGPPTGFVSGELLGWTEDVGDELVIEAIKRAVEQNKPNWGYTKSILQSWSRKKITTVEGVRAEQVQFRNQHQPRNFSQYKQRQPENVPEWFEQQKQQELQAKAAVPAEDIPDAGELLRQFNANKAKQA
ncbi:DnaD domain protein [Terribacillus saccharophilus]|uniref:DnaD domain protein n=1 Tax=Terribacillus saccharophilus TaxID=361277 RepID=UPI003D2892B1